MYNELNALYDDMLVMSNDYADLYGRFQSILKSMNVEAEELEQLIEVGNSINIALKFIDSSIDDLEGYLDEYDGLA